MTAKSLNTILLWNCRNIIDEALFGKDPDVAEDLSDPKSSIEAISRMRQRNEICIVLKRSNLIYTVYLLKNVVEVVFAMFVFTPLNLFYGIHSGLKNDEGLCRVSLLDVPGTDLDGGEALFQVWSHTLFTSRAAAESNSAVGSPSYSW